MRSYRICMIVLGLFLIGAVPAAAISYTRPIVRGSNHGDQCGDDPATGNQCVALNGSILTIGDGTSFFLFDLFTVNNVTQGETIDFTFAASPLLFNTTTLNPNPTPNLNSNFPLFGVLPCETDPQDENNPVKGIYSSLGKLLSTHCSLGDPNDFITNVGFIADSKTQTVSFTLGGTDLPSTLVFAESTSGPKLIPQTVPEPSALLLAMTGFALMGILRFGKSRA